MIVLTAYAELKPEKKDLAISACEKNKLNAVTEKGCEKFDYFFHSSNPNRFVFVEEWTTMEDLQFHFAQPAFAEFMSEMESCLIGPPDIRIFEAQLVQMPSS